MDIGTTTTIDDPVLCALAQEDPQEPEVVSFTSEEFEEDVTRFTDEQMDEMLFGRHDRERERINQTDYLFKAINQDRNKNVKAQADKTKKQASKRKASEKILTAYSRGWDTGFANGVWLTIISETAIALLSFLIYHVVTL